MLKRERFFVVLVVVVVVVVAGAPVAVPTEVEVVVPLPVVGSVLVVVSFTSDTGVVVTPFAIGVGIVSPAPGLEMEALGVT